MSKVGIVFQNIVRLFKQLKNIENHKDIEKQKIDNMSIEEYNQYLLTENDREWEKTKKYFEEILDVAWNDYVSKCKNEKHFISDCFLLSIGQYRITSKMFYSFMYRKKVYISKYSVQYRNSVAIPGYSYLAVYIEKGK